MEGHGVFSSCSTSFPVYFSLFLLPVSFYLELGKVAYRILFQIQGRVMKVPECAHKNLACSAASLWGSLISGLLSSFCHNSCWMAKDCVTPALNIVHIAPWFPSQPRLLYTMTPEKSTPLTPSSIFFSSFTVDQNQEEAPVEPLSPAPWDRKLSGEGWKVGVRWR